MQNSLRLIPTNTQEEIYLLLKDRKCQQWNFEGHHFLEDWKYFTEKNGIRGACQSLSTQIPSQPPAEEINCLPFMPFVFCM